MNDLRFHYSESAKQIEPELLLATLIGAVKADAAAFGFAEAELIRDRHELLSELGIPERDDRGRVLPWQLRECLAIMVSY